MAESNTPAGNARQAALDVYSERGLGKVFYVDSVTGLAGNTGLRPNACLATIAQALAKCTAGRYDEIVCLPTHAETVAAAGLAWNVAGVTIRGLGRGTNRPTLTFSTTDAVVAISAAQVTVKNIKITCSITEVVKAFSVTAADVTFEAVDYYETSTMELIQFILTTNAADRLTVRNCFHYNLAAPTGVSKWIQLVGPDDVLIENNIFHLTLANNAGSVVISGSTALVRGVIRRNSIICLGGTTIASPILLVDSSTTHVYENYVGGTAAAPAAMVDVGNAGYGNQNYALDTPDKSGLLSPAVDT